MLRLLPPTLIFAALAACVRPSEPAPNGAPDAAAAADAAIAGDARAADAELSPTDAGVARDADVLSDAEPETDAGSPPVESMLLEAVNGELRANGRAIEFRGAISCCGGGYGWPIVDESWLDYVALHSINFLHVRLGPFLTGEGGEDEWAATGGGYAVVNGRADLEQFNDAFWSRLRDLIERARDRGMWMEIDLIDGWAIRHCRRGDIPGYSAWAPDDNVQNANECSAAGNGAIAADSVQDRWVRKVVRETGRFDNIIYQDGNEIGLLGNYDPAWSTSMQAIVRDEEANNGYAIHLFGTNSERSEVIGDPAIDYVELHGDEPADPGQCAGKPCLVNEYNPDPPLSPEVFFDHYCAARAMGTYFWYWRHGQDPAAMEASLALIAAGCP